MTLNFKQISFWGKNCPNFLGIKEHGNRLALDLTIETCEVFNCFSERDSLNIFADKTILLTQMTYNFSCMTVFQTEVQMFLPTNGSGYS